MATVNPVRVWQAHDGAADVYEWASISDGDTVGWLHLAPKADKSVHVYSAGAFGGTVTIQGTLETAESPSAPVTLNDSRGEGNPLTFTQNDLRTVLEAVVKLRPSPGAGVSGVTVRVLAVKA